MLTSSQHYLLDDGFKSGHGNDRNPDGHEGAEKITELEDIILHNAEHDNARLITGMVELQKERKKE